MIARHTATYLGSRGVAAALNLGSVAVFTRLAPPESYGTYLYILSWALVLYGATCQWPKFAFFALYEEASESAQVGTVVRILLCSLALAGLGSLLAVTLHLVPARIAGAIVALALGTTLFEGATEIARTRLRAEAVAVSVVARGVLILSLGSAVLAVSGDAVHLALAVAAAYGLASVPAMVTVVPLMPGRGNRAEALRLIAYGWPLVLSFGIAALAQVVDRLIVVKTVGAEELGAYGAIADFLKQSFVVFGEALALSLISIAKREARAGGMAAASAVLADAARAMALVAAFGAAFFLNFDGLVVSILLGPDYRAGAMALAPVLIAASILMMFRAYYFGQIIYFTNSSRLDAVASAATLATVGVLALALIPHLGVAGAAIAFAAGQAAACLVFILGANGRASGLPAMPLPLADFAGIAGLALLAGDAAAAIGLLPGGEGGAARALRFGLLVAGFLAALWRYDIVGIAGVVRGRLGPAPR
ncbi:lipopolysaccharide biosynthesis protein [uncultured Methylobacterium sp.]|uniref:lipopolysaccharide biosynthesis protein n=1 Tax=uncultured Methylobacterium sp. TaxID=157278 RepID=UPI0035CAD36F